MRSAFSRVFLPAYIPGHLLHGRGSAFRLGFPAQTQSQIYLEQVGNRYFQKVSSNHQPSGERSIRLNRKQFEALWEQCGSRTISGTRVVHRISGQRVQLDFFKGKLEGLVTVIIEFESLEASFSTNLPEWLGPEITYDRRFGIEELTNDSQDLGTLPNSLEAMGENLMIGAIPYIRDLHQIRFVTINTRRNNRIIFPKGQPESEFSPSEVATMEALEEAGVEGLITGHPILIPYKQYSPKNWLLYPLEISRVKRNWKEKGERTRKYMSEQVLREDPQCANLVPAVEYVSRLVRAKAGVETASFR